MKESKEDLNRQKQEMIDRIMLMPLNELRLRISALKSALEKNRDSHKLKLSPSQREVLKGRIAKEMEKNQEFAKRVMEEAPSETESTKKTKGE